MLNDSDMKIITHLRQNSRETLTKMSKKINIPVSTIYDRIKFHENSILKGFTSLLDFAQLGFNTRVYILFKAASPLKAELRKHIEKHQNINCIFKINNDYDFLLEAVFKNIKELEQFVEDLEVKYKVYDSKILYVVEDIKREAFMSNPNITEILDAKIQ